MKPSSHDWEVKEKRGDYKAKIDAFIEQHRPKVKDEYEINGVKVKVYESR